jgi:hypothetical protein
MKQTRNIFCLETYKNTENNMTPALWLSYKCSPLPLGDLGESPVSFTAGVTRRETDGPQNKQEAFRHP